MKEYLSFLVTLSPDELAALNGGAVGRVYRSVWSTVTAFLAPWMGRWFESFYPSPTPWGLPAPPSPLGIVLGKVDPNAFQYLLMKAEAAQEKVRELHQADILQGICGTNDLDTLPKTFMRVVSMEAGSETAMHLVWLHDFSSGRLVPEGSLYYLPQKRYEMDERTFKAVLSAPERHAVCTVELYTETPKFMPEKIEISPLLPSVTQKEDLLRDLKRLMHGDWGESSQEEMARNNAAVAAGAGVIRSVYYSGDTRYIIRTSADHKAVKLLLEDEEAEDESDV